MKTTLTFAALLMPLIAWAAPAGNAGGVNEIISTSDIRAGRNDSRGSGPAWRDDRYDPRHDDRDDRRRSAPPPVVVMRYDYDRVIRNAYRDILEREPDAGGLRNYRDRMMKEGWSEDRVRAALRDSAEFRGTVVNNIITRAYRDILGRAPDAGGLENYRYKMIAKGLSEEGLRRTLLDSREYRDRLVMLAANDARNGRRGR